MSAWRQEAEQRVAEVAVARGAWREWDDAVGALPAPSPLVALSLVGHAPSGDERRRLLERLHAAAAPETMLVVADHNRPRRWPAALAALCLAPRVPGGSPASRWRRLAYPTAREMQNAGFRVVRLALVCHERVQIVIARRTTAG